VIPNETIRVSCRVVLLDGEERVLLLEHAGSLDDGFSSIWVPPGGGLEPGESFEQAALRELWEETGLRLPGLGPKVWIRPLRFPVNGVIARSRNTSLWVMWLHSMLANTKTWMKQRNY
jgi:8-oxo-dGTP pyrophosphatase MutT (NUDIX family)